MHKVARLLTMELCIANNLQTSRQRLNLVKTQVMWLQLDKIDVRDVSSVTLKHSCSLTKADFIERRDVTVMR